MQRSTVISIVILAVGLVCHAFGFTYDKDDEQYISHAAGGFFDILAGVIVWFNRKKKPEPTLWDYPIFFLVGMLAFSSIACVQTQDGRVVPFWAANKPPRTNVDKVSDLEGWFNIAMSVLVTARSYGILDDETYVQVDKFVQAFNKGLDQLKIEAAKADAEGGDIQASALFRATQAALDGLLLAQTEYEPRVKEHRAKKLSAPVAPSSAPSEPEIPLPVPIPE